MAERYYVGKAHWLSILHAWQESYQIIAAQPYGEERYFTPLTASTIGTVVYDQVRTVQPLKSYFLPALDEVTEELTDPPKPWLFLGVKACDLSALSILDQAFGGEYSDPRYQKRRHESLIVSSDCTDPKDSCFCTCVDGAPYTQKGFDLNLSKIWDGLVVEVGSLRGRELLEGHDQALKEVVKEEAETLEKIRQETTMRVEAVNADFRFNARPKDILDKVWESDVWKNHVKTCVECGACNHACPTCHCYFLDDVTRDAFVKLRGWDACQYSGYAVTAGGGTPRPHLMERFRNRYYCKFSHLISNYGHLGCTGCGRCIEACQGKIDMRTVLTELTAQAEGKK